MGQALEREGRYSSVIKAIVALENRRRGWDSYGGVPVEPKAQVNAIRLVVRFPDVGDSVPAPEVGLAPDGGVVLRWLTVDREVDIHFAEWDGDYTIVRRDAGEVVEEGRLGSLDPLKDIVNAHVLGRKRLDRAPARYK